MSARFRILLGKEFSQNAWVFLATAAVLFLIGLITWIEGKANALETSQMRAASTTVTAFVPVIGLILGHRMVVREYQARTQLFVEALPLRRWEMVLAKYCVGLFGISTLMLAAVWAFAALSAETSGKFLLVVSLKTIGYVLPLWTTFFTLGLLGRLRLAGYITLGAGLLLLDGTSGFEIGRFGPLALIDANTFPYERSVIPLRALLESVLVSAALLGVGLGVALVHEGSVAERLAGRASPREVVAVGVLLFAEVMAVSWAQSKQKLAPFEFTSAAVLRSRSGAVQIMYGWPLLEPSATLVARALDELRSSFARELDVHDLPALRIAHNALLGRREVSEKQLPDTSGVLLEANLGFADRDLENLLARVAHSSLGDQSRGRGLFEPNHWLLDGFACWLASERSPEAKERYFLDAALAARTLRPDADAITHWEQTMERLGEPAANALAFSLVALLHERHGRAKTRSLARGVLGQPGVTNVLTWLTRRDTDLPRSFSKVTGEPWPVFVAFWQKELERRAARDPLLRKLAEVPDDRAELRVQHSRIGADLVYALSGPKLMRDRECALIHTKLRPYDLYLPTQGLPRHVIPWKAGELRAEGRLRGAYQTGERAFAAIECEVSELQARTRLVALRFTAP